MLVGPQVNVVWRDSTSPRSRATGCCEARTARATRLSPRCRLTSAFVQGFDGPGPRDHLLVRDRGAQRLWALSGSRAVSATTPLYVLVSPDRAGRSRRRRSAWRSPRQDGDRGDVALGVYLDDVDGPVPQRCVPASNAASNRLARGDASGSRTRGNPERRRGPGRRCRDRRRPSRNARRAGRADSGTAAICRGPLIVTPDLLAPSALCGHVGEPGDPDLHDLGARKPGVDEGADRGAVRRGTRPVRADIVMGVQAQQPPRQKGRRDLSGPRRSPRCGHRARPSVRRRVGEGPGRRRDP